MADSNAQMKCFFVEGENASIKIIDKPVPEIDEVLIKISRAGICLTDLEIMKGYMGFKGVVGHEFVGKVVGPISSPIMGKRICGEINLPCHKCDTCDFKIDNSLGIFHPKNRMSLGRNHCPNRTVLGILNKHGTYAEYLTLPQSNCHLVPDDLSDAEATFIEPIAAAFRPWEQGSISDGMSVCVIGDGRLGLLCAVVAAFKGNPITMIGKHEDKMKLLPKDVNQILLSDSTQTDFSRRFDVVIECSGHASGFALANAIIKPMGTIVLKTTVHDVSTRTLSNLIVIDEVNVVGSRCGPFPDAIQLLKEKFFDVTTLIHAEFNLSEVEEAIKKASEKGILKVHLLMS